MVFGDDSSNSADLAWPGWRVEVLTAVMPDPVVARWNLRRRANGHRPNPRRAFAEARFDQVVQLTIDSDPRLALCRPADLLVVGQRGPGLAKAMHLGSTVEWLMTRPPAPMLIRSNRRRAGRGDRYRVVGSSRGRGRPPHRPTW